MILSGQLDINVNTNFEIAIQRHVVTTNTYQTNQTYDIVGTTDASAPEPASWELTLAGALAIAFGLARRNRHRL